ncbi:MAG: Type 1 glutamine amidotransferase-like domain-containing protein [Oscillospiraceae bacterium]|nr:Type 1 glutamine amidotransferase-like domain-containing protein [Oscillospiraceae bacterium]
MTAVLLSGFDTNGFFASVVPVLKNAVTDTESLLFIASDPHGFQKTDEYAARIFRFFHESGMLFDRYAILDARMPDGEQINAITEASCVFLMGGTTLRQLDYLNAQNLIEPLRRHTGMVIGMSAGAINMAKRSVLANPDFPPVKIFEGIGLTDISVVPHFGDKTAEYIQTGILPLTADGTIYGLCDDAVIVLKDGTETHSGTICKLTPNTITYLSSDDSL